MARELERLRAQVLQIDALRDAGTLDAAAHAEARARAERQLLDHVLAQPAPGDAPWRAVLAVGALALGVMALGWLVLRPGAPAPSPLAAARPAPAPASAPHAMEQGAMRAMVQGLERRLADRPADAEGWAMLGRSYAVLGDPARAVPAFRKALALRPDDAGLQGELAAVQSQAPDAK